MAITDPPQTTITTTTTTPAHPATLVPNIKISIPIILDMDNGLYTAWVELFKIQCRACNVLHHIIPSSKTSSSNEPIDQALFSRIDAIVLQWIYSTISKDLLRTILTRDTTAEKAWLALKSIFVDNRASRALYLQNQFSNTKLDSFSTASAYCQQLKVLSDQLADVETPLTNDQLVLQLIAGLNDQYESFATFLQQSSPLPDFYSARSKLILEESSKQNRSSSTTSNATALHTNTTNPTQLSSTTSSTHHPPNNNHPTTETNNTRYNNRNPDNSRGRGRGNRGRGRNGGRGRGRNTNQYYGYNQQSAPQFYPPQWQSPWHSPPVPYPTVPQQRPLPNRFGQGLLGPHPAQAHAAAAEYYTPTYLDQAFQTMALNPPDQNWYLDTGATNHMTNNTGLPDADTYPPM